MSPDEAKKFDPLPEKLAPSEIERGAGPRPAPFLTDLPRRIPWQWILPFILLSAASALFISGLAFWFFDLFDRPGRLRFLLLALGAAGSAALVIGYTFSKRLLAPLFQMTQLSRSIAGGRRPQPLLIRTGDELEALADALNRMAEEVQKKIQGLSDDRAQTIALLSGMIEGVVVLDERGKVVLTNSSFEKMFGLSGAEWVGRYYYEVLRHHDLNKLVEEVIRTARPLSREMRLDFSFRPHFQVQASVTRGPRVSVVLVFHDITEIKRLERIRKDFVANVSHELRTPLAAILGYLETLVDEGMENPEQVKEYLMILQKHSHRMQNIVQDLLQLSRIESGLDPIRTALIPLKECVEKNILLLSPLAQKKGQTLRCAVPSGVHLAGDPEKINQVIVNLLDNAMKYSPEGGTVEIRGKEEKRTVEIEVEDTGIGIPAEDLDRVFERFYRVDRTRSRELGGTGLGLSIVKHIVEAHNGKVSVQSVLGKGSCFKLSFPKSTNDSAA